MLKVLIRNNVHFTEIGLRTKIARERKGLVFYVTDHNHQEKKKKREKFEVCNKRTSIIG